MEKASTSDFTPANSPPFGPASRGRLSRRDCHHNLVLTAYAFICQKSGNLATLVFYSESIYLTLTLILISCVNLPVVQTTAGVVINDPSRRVVVFQGRISPLLSMLFADDPGTCFSSQRPLNILGVRNERLSAAALKKPQNCLHFWQHRAPGKVPF